MRVVSCPHPPSSPLLSSPLQMVCERADAFASACALARAFPLFTHRSGASRRTEKKTVTVEFFLVGQDNGPVEVSTLQVGVWMLSLGLSSAAHWAAGSDVCGCSSPSGEGRMVGLLSFLRRPFLTAVGSLSLRVVFVFRMRFCAARVH